MGLVCTEAAGSTLTTQDIHHDCRLILCAGAAMMHSSQPSRTDSRPVEEQQFISDGELSGSRLTQKG